MTHPSLAEVAHRPWPLPAKAWTWQQSWLDLAFLHYPIAFEAVARRLPAGLTLQQFGGSAWLGVVPFRMVGLTPRALRGLFTLPEFPELNLRTYVEAEGKPGVWFFSLDAASWPVVSGGRRLFGLPYFKARMQQIDRNGWINFGSSRCRSTATFSARYRPRGEQLVVRSGSFEQWATERYSLYAMSPRGKLQRMEVHHAPWPLYEAEVHLDDHSVMEAAGFDVAPTPPICHCSPGVHVVSFDPEPVPANRSL